MKFTEGREENWSVHSEDNTPGQSVPVPPSHSVPVSVNANGTISSGNASDSEDINDVFRKLNDVSILYYVTLINACFSLLWINFGGGY